MHKYITGFPNKLYKFKPNTPQNRQISSSKSQKKPFSVFWRHFWKPFCIWKLLLPSKIKLLIPHHGENIVGWSRGTPTGNLLLSRDRNGNFSNCIAKVQSKSLWAQHGPLFLRFILSKLPSATNHDSKRIRHGRFLRGFDCPLPGNKCTGSLTLSCTKVKGYNSNLNGL